MSQIEVSASIAINAFLEAIKDAAAEDPNFRARLVHALDLTVLYEGDEQFEGANPVRQAKRWSMEAFKRIWSSAKVGQIKAAIKAHGLATTTDMKGLNKAALIELLYRRAEEKSRNDGRI
ncbi:MAG: hypothetical protein AAGL90_04450 [Pseudomonadota bacterium]